MSVPDPIPNPSDLPTVRQDVTGDRNQTIAQMFGEMAIANVETLNQITQQLARSPETARYSLPLDAADFVGRRNEIELMEADVKAGRGVAIAPSFPILRRSEISMTVSFSLTPNPCRGRNLCSLTRGWIAPWLNPLETTGILVLAIRCMAVKSAQTFDRGESGSASKPQQSSPSS